MYCGRLVSATVWYQVSAARLIAVIFMIACPDNVLEGDEEGCGGHRQTTGLLGHTAKHCQVRTSPIETPPPADTTHRPTDRWTVPLLRSASHHKESQNKSFARSNISQRQNRFTSSVFGRRLDLRLTVHHQYR